MTGVKVKIFKKTNTELTSNFEEKINEFTKRVNVQSIKLSINPDLSMVVMVTYL